MSARKRHEKAARRSASGAVSRRNFIATTAASGMALGAGPAAAFAQAPGTTASPANALPKGQTERMFQGTAAAALVEQLRAAGVNMLFHTNTSGFVPLWEAIHHAGDVQVINMTHEGQAVAAAAGYTMASKKLGFFFGSGAGIGNAMSNVYCAWKDRVPLLVTFGAGTLEDQGKDGFESWDDELGPTRPFTLWTASLLADEMTGIVRRAIKYAFGPPSGPVTLGWGEANPAQRVEAPIYNIDLAKARHRPRAQPAVIEKAAQWLAEAENPTSRGGQEFDIKLIDTVR